jgi:hypothetical protein
MPNYSYFLGDIGSEALSNLYYPHADRGIGLVFTNAAIGIAGKAGGTIIREFFLEAHYDECIHRRKTLNVRDGGEEIVRRLCADRPSEADRIDYALDSGKRTRPFSLARATHKDSRFHARSEFSRRDRSADQVCGEGC